MIRVALVSDLHLEFSSSLPCDLSGLAAEGDILLAAGDISNGTDAIDWCAGSPIPVVYVPGNHEFYRHDIGQTRIQMAAYAERFDHVHMLDPGVVEFEIHGQRIRVISATLWTDYKLNGDQEHGTAVAVRGLNDHRLIGYDGGRWHPIDAIAAFETQRDFIAAELAKPFDGLSIVMTHHAPSLRVVAPKYVGDPMSPAFASHLDDLVAQADVWAYGHTHFSAETQIGKCRVISNQRGYRNENFGWKMRIYEFEVPGKPIAETVRE